MGQDGTASHRLLVSPLGGGNRCGGGCGSHDETCGSGESEQLIYGLRVYAASSACRGKYVRMIQWKEAEVVGKKFEFRNEPTFCVCHTHTVTVTLTSPHAVAVLCWTPSASIAVNAEALCPPSRSRSQFLRHCRLFHAARTGASPPRHYPPRALRSPRRHGGCPSSDGAARED